MKKNLAVALMTLVSFATHSQVKIVGYYPTSHWNNLYQVDLNHLSHLCASFANPTEDGEIIFDQDLSTFVSAVHRGNVKAILSIGGGGDYSWGDKHKIYEKLWESQESRTTFVHKIMNFLRKYKLDGLDNDIEGFAMKLKNFNVFSQELGDSLHASNLEYSMAVGVDAWIGEAYVNDTTLQKFDFVSTMSYGGVGDWNWDKKPDEGTYGKMVSDVAKLISRGMKPKEVCGGIPFYAVEFPRTQQSTYWMYNQKNCNVYNRSDYGNINPLHTDTIYTKDSSVIYINSLETYYKKMDHLFAQGSGLMIWQVAYDCSTPGNNVMDYLAKYMDEKEVKLDVSGLESLISIERTPKNEISFKTGGLKAKKLIIKDINSKIVYEGKPNRKLKIENFQGGEISVEITLSDTKKITKKVLL